LGKHLGWEGSICGKKKRTVLMRNRNKLEEGRKDVV